MSSAKIKHTSVFMYSAPYFGPISTKREISRHVFKKVLNMNGNPSTRSCSYRRGQTDELTWESSTTLFVAMRTSLKDSIKRQGYENHSHFFLLRQIDKCD